MEQCKCFNSNGVSFPHMQCMKMPNRFRKVLNEKGHWDEAANFDYRDCQERTSMCDAMALEEFGPGHWTAWCCSMEPVIISGYPEERMETLDTELRRAAWKAKQEEKV